MIKNPLGLVLAVLTSLTFIPSALAQDVDDVDCNDAMTTLDINYCAAQEGEIADKQMRRYLIASYTQYNDSPEIVEAIKASQLAWKDYANSNCQAVYESWRTGTIRGLMSISCHTRMKKERTHDLWLNYLTFMDSTPPILPEPME